MFDFGLSKKERVAVFIDGPAFYSQMRDAGIITDFNKLRAAIKAQCDSISAVHYATIVPANRDEHNQLFPLIKFLETNGFRLHKKEVRMDCDAEGFRRRSSMAVVLASVLQYVPSGIDHILLFTDDLDLAPALNILRSMTGVRVSLVAPLSKVSPTLGASVDAIIDISQNFAAFRATVAKADTMQETFHQPVHASFDGEQPVISAARLDDEDDYDPLIHGGSTPMPRKPVPDLAVLAGAKMGAVVTKRRVGRPSNAAKAAEAAARAAGH